MSSIRVQGGKPLSGEVLIQGSKNGSLPVLAATVLVPGVSVIENCPRITDVDCMCRLLSSIGAQVKREGTRVTVNAACLTGCALPHKYVTRMRSSVILLGAMLGRLHEANLDYPGGCVIGERPIDFHTQGLQEMGVRYVYREEGLTAYADRLTGTRVVLPFPSVGATENLILAAVLAEGVTEIVNPAREPEIEALCLFLSGAGAQIEGAGSSSIRIRGVSGLRESRFTMMPDRIVAGTYLYAAAAAGGEIYLRGAPADQLLAVMQSARRMGLWIRTDEEGIRVSRRGSLHALQGVSTRVYPGFPTDLQSPLTAALTQADGTSRVTENIFKDRFRIVPELARMGASLSVEQNTVTVRGGRRLRGSVLQAMELRGGAALVLAALAAEGESWITETHFVDRGYEDIARDLRALGGNVSQGEGT